MLKESLQPLCEVQPPIPSIDQLAFTIGMTIRKNGSSNEQPRYGGETIINTDHLTITCLEDMSTRADHNFALEDGEGHMVVLVDSANVFARGFMPNKQVITYSVQHDGRNLHSEPTIHEDFWRKGFTSIKNHLDSLNQPPKQIVVFEDAAGT